MARKRPRWLPHPIWLGISAAVVVAVAVPVLHTSMPAIKRWHTLNQLTAADTTERRRALNYVIRHAGDDPAVRDGAIARLDDASERAHFIALVNALDRAGVWSREHVPDDAWLRWLRVLANDQHPASRRIAAEQLARMTGLADDARVQAQLRALFNDEAEAVRYEALRAAALQAGEAADRAAYARMIADAREDDAARVARHAWILSGLLESDEASPSTEPDWRSADVEVAEAMLWARARRATEAPPVIREALNDDNASMRLRAMAVYALANVDDAQQAIALAAEPLRGDAASTQPAASIAQQRRLLLLHHLHARAPDAVASALRAQYDPAQLKQMLATAPAATQPAAKHQALITALAPLSSPIAFAENDDLTQYDAHALRAYLESCPRGNVTFTDLSTMTPMMRIAAVRKMRDPEPAMLDRAFVSEHAMVRDLACLAAVERFDEATLETLTETLLDDLNDERKMSGAILSGLTGAHTDLLARRAAQEDIWRVQTVMFAGLWMQDARPRMGGRIRALLVREDLPRTSLLLAMLHRRDRRALDYLLAPHGEPALNLPVLLVHYRWWEALDRYLPDDAPPLWLWADDALHRFQIDVLRDWHLLHRGELTEQGWRD